MKLTSHYTDVNFVSARRAVEDDLARGRARGEAVLPASSCEEDALAVFVRMPTGQLLASPNETSSFVATYDDPAGALELDRARDPRLITIEIGEGTVALGPDVESTAEPPEYEGVQHALSLVTQPIHRHGPPSRFLDPLICGEAVAA